jgi:hypothetical protein
MQSVLETQDTQFPLPSQNMPLLAHEVCSGAGIIWHWPLTQWACWQGLDGWGQAI